MQTFEYSKKPIENTRLDSNQTMKKDWDYMRHLYEQADQAPQQNEKQIMLSI